ncbi:hypothetical protein OCK74_07005 [Chitinophagaceae bacterium LB-8]|uniref:Uncharacterized protein n=1 Tax=Paraflavisolibacter caeni TaxID=2982496 RepID=A0A9X2XUI4_9BACT|nr:hypothetical protein [Paraflavisolibacter caeni]MCU7548860.1 hypothetical protein [Paraflavisolibacter caeni]
MRSLFIFITCTVIFCSCARTDSPAKDFTPAVSNLSVALGDTSFTIQVSIFDSSSRLIFVHIHDDEQTAKNATHRFLEHQGGTLISIQNNGERLITFPFNGRSYTFDPNRMLTRKGIIESLQILQPFDEKAVPEVERFANSLLQKIPAKSYVIAMHNNTANNYSVLSYLPNGSLQGEAEKVHVSKKMDPDDFVFTTDHRIFNGLQKRDISVVLQKEIPATDDGSLSILFGRRKIAYTNIEAEHNHINDQLQLLEAVANIAAK